MPIHIAMSWAGHDGDAAVGGEEEVPEESEVVLRERLQQVFEGEARDEERVCGVDEEGGGCSEERRIASATP